MIAAPAGAVLVVLTLSLVVSNIALLRQNRALKQILRVHNESAYLEPGQAMSPLRGLDLQENEQTLDFADGPGKTVLLVFQPKCSWCQKNMDNWAILLDLVDRRRYRFVAVATRPEGVAEYIDRYRELSGLPIIADLHLEDRLRFRLFDTPQTIVIDSDGVVEKIWLGALGGRMKQDAESYFGVTLPGTRLPDTQQLTKSSATS